MIAHTKREQRLSDRCKHPSDAATAPLCIKNAPAKGRIFYASSYFS